MKQITGASASQSKMIKTTAEAIEPEIDFGTFPKSEVKKAIIEIKNTGNAPLVIVDVTTTCGCTAATYDKAPAKPGDILGVEITMTPKDTGFFDEVATIKCNTTSPVKVRIRGHIQ